MFELSRLKKRARSIAVGAAASGMVIGNVASVAALNTSSMTLSDSRPSQASVTYTFDSDGWDTVTSINCVQVVFSVNADGTGGVPAGMTTTGADFLASSTALTHGSWTETFTANGTLELTAGNEAVLASPSNLVFNGITNPNTDATFFATVDTYTNADCATGPTDNAVVAFATKDGTPVSLTIDPTLTFTCAGVASGSVNGATITHTSVGSSIDYLNDVTSAQEGVSAHDITVTSNATNGWTVYIQHTGQLTSGTDTIDNHTGTNLSPSTMSNGTEQWGYTSEDATLSAVGDGADRFTNPGNEWAGFTTSAEEVITDESGATRVGHQVNVAATTEAGTYTSTIVYTVVATF